MEWRPSKAGTFWKFLTAAHPKHFRIPSNVCVDLRSNIFFTATWFLHCSHYGVCFRGHNLSVIAGMPVLGTPLKTVEGHITTCNCSVSITKVTGATLSFSHQPLQASAIKVSIRSMSRQVTAECLMKLSFLWRNPLGCAFSPFSAPPKPEAYQLLRITRAHCILEYVASQNFDLIKGEHLFHSWTINVTLQLAWWSFPCRRILPHLTEQLCDLKRKGWYPQRLSPCDAVSPLVLLVKEVFDA